MSIETLLAENTAAIRELIATIKAQAYAEVSQPATTKPAPEPESKATFRINKNHPQIEVIKALATPVVEDTPEAHATPADPETLVTLDEIKAAVLKLAATKGRDAAVGVLQSFGAAKAPELKPEQYGDALTALNNAMVG